MDEKQLFDAINAIDDKLVEEALEYKQSKSEKRIRFKSVFSRLIAAALVVITVTGTGLTVLATVNTDFKDWIFQSFGGLGVYEITILNDNTATLKVDENTRIVGENESFIEKYNYDSSDYEIVSDVYKIKNNKTVKLKKKTFEGSYAGISFKFDYCTTENEIDAFNYSDSMSEVFHYKNGDVVYMALDDEKHNIQYLLEIDLKSESILCIHKNKHLCNMKMSPNGKTILLNYRALEYWTVIDLKTKQETRLDSINPYAHTNEILFLNDYLIETYGDFDVEGDTEVQRTIVIDLKNFESRTVCKCTGDICVNWLYRYDADKNALEIKNLYRNSSFYVSDVPKNNSISIVTADKNFALFYDEISAEYALCNLTDETSMRFSVPETLSDEGDIEFNIADNESKLIITDGNTAYLININFLSKG